MKTCGLLARLTLGLLILSGCGSNTAPPEVEPLDIEGSWLYLGPSDGPHTLLIGRTSIDYADVSGMWSSKWTITAHDNSLHHFQMEFYSGSGPYLPLGTTKSGTYEASGTLLTIQLANGGSYPQLQGFGTCTAAADGMPIPDCSLYVKH